MIGLVKFSSMALKKKRKQKKRLGECIHSHEYCG